MNCDLFQENASRFMDGLLDASDQAALFAHLSTCPDCRSFLSASVRVREVVRNDAVALPPGIDEAFFEQLLSRHATGADSRRRPETFWRRDVLLSVPLAAAALLLVVLASVLFSLLFLKTGAGGPAFETVFGEGQASAGRQTIVVVYQLPEEQVVRLAPAKMFEVNARTVAN